MLPGFQSGWIGSQSFFANSVINCGCFLLVFYWGKQLFLTFRTSKLCRANMHYNCVYGYVDFQLYTFPEHQGFGCRYPILWLQPDCIIAVLLTCSEASVSTKYSRKNRNWNKLLRTHLISARRSSLAAYLLLSTTGTAVFLLKGFIVYSCSQLRSEVKLIPVMVGIWSWPCALWVLAS